MKGHKRRLIKIFIDRSSDYVQSYLWLMLLLLLIFSIRAADNQPKCPTFSESRNAVASKVSRPEASPALSTPWWVSYPLFRNFSCSECSRKSLFLPTNSTRYLEDELNWYINIPIPQTTWSALRFATFPLLIASFYQLLFTRLFSVPW